MKHMLRYVIPSDPQTGFSILLHEEWHTQVGWLFIILQMEYGILEQFFIAQVSLSGE